MLTTQQAADITAAYEQESADASQAELTSLRQDIDQRLENAKQIAVIPRSE